VPADPKAYTHPFTVTLNEYLEPAAELMDFLQRPTSKVTRRT